MKCSQLHRWRHVFLCLTCLSVCCACGTSLHTYLLRDDGDGGKIHNEIPWGDYGDVIAVANRYCSSRGLETPVITDPYKLPYAVKHYEFKCSKRSVTPPQIQQQTYSNSPAEKQAAESDSESSSNSIQAAKEKCLELGFSMNTESFGKCVIQLTK